ncbi:MAG: M10 family metallopeptidase C-terminal domain-containing protein, partial [Bradyrhizobium sp.]
PDSGDSVVQVWVSDRSAGGGHLTFNGVVQNDNQAFGISIGQLGQWAFLAGGTDTIAFQTVDTHGAFSATAFATVTASAPAPNNPPATPTPNNQTVASGTSVALSTLFTGLTDPDSGDSVTQVWVSDRSAGGGHLTFNGVVQNDNQAFGPIQIGQLGQWAFLAGGNDTIAFQTVDSHGTFSATAFATVNVSANTPISNGTVNSETGNTIAGSSANDVMVGGGGSDTFVFAPNFGRDTISNFESGQDIIQIDRSIFADAAAVFSHAAEDGRGSVVIAHDEGNTITLQNLTLAGLHAGDFHLI